MKNETTLKKSLEDLNEFYKNSLYIERKNNLNAKHLFGHSLFKKSENVPFNAFVMISLSIILSAIYFYLHSIGMVTFNFLTASFYIAGFSTIPFVILTNSIYHLNRFSSGKIGRTYTRMGFDMYFKNINEKIKKKYKLLFNDKQLTKKTKNKMIEFANMLEGYASNFNYRYTKLAKRVQKFKPKKQAKWLPILETIEYYNTYLLANSEKFSTYAEVLKSDYQENKDFQFSEIKETVIDSKPTLIYQEDLKNTSNFELFKKYILRKKQLEKQRLQKFDEQIKF